MLFGLAGLVIALDLLVSWKQCPEVFQGGLRNPDSYMRLVRIRQGLHHGGFAHIVVDDGSGHGTLLYWSHLLDAIILAIRWPLLLVLPPEAALRWAGEVIGPLSMAGLAAAMGWAGAPFVRWRWLPVAVLLPIVCPALIGYGLLGCVHHHVALAMIAILCGGAAARSLAGQRAAVWLGVWGGIGLWLSPESVPFTLLAFGALGLGWILADGKRPSAMPRGAIGQAATAFFLVSGGALLIDPPLGGVGVAMVDRLSVVYLALAAMLLLLAGALHVIDRCGVVGRWQAGLGLAAAAAGLGGWVLFFPNVARGTGGLMTPAQARQFFGPILEMAPVSGIGQAWELLGSACLAAGFVTWRAVRTRSWLWGYAAICCAGLVGLGSVHVRFAAYAEAAGALAAPLAVGWFDHPSMHQDARARIARLLVLIAFLLLPIAPELAYALGVMHPAAIADPPSCHPRDAALALAPYAGAIVLANVNDTPELLYATRLKTVGSLYHRGLAGFLRLQAAWNTTPPWDGGVPDTLRATGATLVLICDDTKSPEPLTGGPHSLLDVLHRDHIPPWLIRLRLNPSAGYSLFGISGVR